MFKFLQHKCPPVVVAAYPLARANVPGRGEYDGAFSLHLVERVEGLSDSELRQEGDHLLVSSLLRPGLQC